MIAIGLHLLRCPRCTGPMTTRRTCPKCGEFPAADGQPVLVDFDNSILDRARFEARAGASPVVRSAASSRLKRLLLGPNRAAERVAGLMSAQVGKSGRVLVIGGGEIGSGAEALYAGCDVVGVDIYPSPHTQIVADAHSLPFVDEAFEGVWIQAVLEHVLDPETVVDEIHRVLKPGGLVYADTPFMQQVHEGAYDFTRFTLSGQRWLFRRFEMIEGGATSGAGSALVWSIRHFVRAVSGSRRLGQAVSGLFFWLSWFDGRSQRHEDAAGGTWLYARKGVDALKPQDMVAFYDARRTRNGA